MEKKKHYGLKLVALIIVIFGVWIYFWDKPAPEKTVVVDLGHEVLQN